MFINLTQAYTVKYTDKILYRNPSYNPTITYCMLQVIITGNLTKKC